MKEYIERASVHSIIERTSTFAFTRGGMHEKIDSLPAADVVEVVRCRECKWFNHYTMECESDDVATDNEGGASFSINFGPDDFCSYGQRKEDDHEVS